MPGTIKFLTDVPKSTDNLIGLKMPCCDKPAPLGIIEHQSFVHTQCKLVCLDAQNELVAEMGTTEIEDAGPGSSVTFECSACNKTILDDNEEEVKSWEDLTAWLKMHTILGLTERSIHTELINKRDNCNARNRKIQWIEFNRWAANHFVIELTGTGIKPGEREFEWGFIHCYILDGEDRPDYKFFDHLGNELS
jgi:hypothetical protein